MQVEDVFTFWRDMYLAPLEGRLSVWLKKQLLDVVARLKEGDIFSERCCTRVWYFRNFLKPFTRMFGVSEIFCKSILFDRLPYTIVDELIFFKLPFGENLYLVYFEV